MSKEKVITNALVSSLLGLTISFFAPLQLYYTNILEFQFRFSEIASFIFFVTFLFILVLSVILSTLKKALLHQKIVSLFFVISILFWIQGNILVWNFGVFDGKEIHWNEYKFQGFIEFSIWFILLIFSLIKSSTIYRFIRPGCISLIIIQCISIFISWYQAPAEPEWKNYSVNTTSNFVYSSEKNIIILLLDTFQTDIFQEIINEDPSIKNEFNGFIYFRNSLGGFSTTYPSVPLILTGEYYDNSVPIQEYIKKSFIEKSLPLILNRHGYQVDLFPLTNSTIYLNEDIVDSNFKVRNYNSKKGTFELYSVALFRYMPIYAKKYFYGFNFRNINDYVYERDLEFVKKAIEDSKVRASKPTFKFFHLWGAHPPFQLNERLMFENLPYDRQGYKTQAKAAIEITKKFLTSLKNIGAYENSMIFIIGDHGFGTFGINYAGKLIYNSVVGSGIPLILVKPFGSNGDLKISDAPVSLSDIPKTVLTELGIENDNNGLSMLDIKEDSTRERKFLYYEWGNVWDKEYLPSMQEYIVSGFSWDDKFWRKTYRIYTSNGIEEAAPPLYQIGSVIQFGKGGNAQVFQEMGWSPSEEDGLTWTNGKMASLAFSITEPKTDLKLSADFTPFISGEINKQSVNVFVNGTEVGSWIANQPGEYQMIIPKKLLTDSKIDLRFEFPDAVSPAEMKIGNDSRILGVAMKNIVLTELNVYQYGTLIQFGEGGDARNFQEEGWSSEEKGFTWTNGKIATMVLPIESPKSDLILSAELTPFIFGDIDKQRVGVIINGEEIGEWKASEPGKYQMKIPKQIVTGPILRVKFALPDAISPSELGIGDDVRMLGIALKSLIISEKE
jgi:hypothetical protein